MMVDLKSSAQGKHVVEFTSVGFIKCKSEFFYRLRKFFVYPVSTGQFHPFVDKIKMFVAQHFTTRTTYQLNKTSIVIKIIILVPLSLKINP